MKLTRIFLPLILLMCFAACNDSTPKSPANTPESPQPKAQTRPAKSQLLQTTEMLLQEVFPEFKKVKMDQMDAFPVFQSTAQTFFFRLQRKSPIPNKINRQSYPRIIYKAYAFRQKEDLINEVTAWLNKMESSSENIALGDAVERVKTPPLLCGIAGQSFFIVQAACIYDGPEWAENKARFFATMKDLHAEFAWQIKCDGGALEYEIVSEK